MASERFRNCFFNRYRFGNQNRKHHFGQWRQTNSTSLTHQKTNLGLFKFSSTYKPNEKFQADYDILAKRSQQDENNDLLRQSIVQNVSAVEAIHTLKQQNPTSVNQSLGLYYTQNDKNVFVFEMQHLYQDE